MIAKRMAKLMALECFRNTCLENLHTGTFPHSMTGDYSDIKVVTPFGEIPWNQLARISEEEMTTLMKEVVNHCYAWAVMLLDAHERRGLVQRVECVDRCPQWDEPKMPEH